jgi:putative transposase
VAEEKKARTPVVYARNARDWKSPRWQAFGRSSFGRGSWSEIKEAFMGRSKVEIYLHFVWATKGRQPWLVGDVERAAHRCIQSEAREMGCEVLALGGMPDHVHLLASVSSGVSSAALAKQLKGASSRLVSGQVAPGSGFGWQEGYGVFSVSRSHVQRVKSYVLNQNARHTADRTWPDWEETDEPAEQ